jgi:UbiD family decarboxylase
VIVRGADVDLTALPAPLIHEGDGGRYLASWGVAIAREPGSGYVAWDLLPMMVVGKNRLAGTILPGSPIGLLSAQATEPVPMAIALGTVPAAVIAAGLTTARRRGTTSAEIAGGLQREPLHLVKAEDSDLLVPATAEVVLEGVLLPGETVMAGPFASRFGYRGTPAGLAPVFEVHTITRREQPVVTFSSWGTPIGDIHIVRGLDADAQLKQSFAKKGWPVADVFTPPWLAGNLVAVSSKIPFSAFSQSIAGVVRSTDATRTIPYVAVYDDDIDILNPVSLFHAMVTKCHPHRDTWLVKDSPAAPDAPHLSADELARGSGPSMIFDCTWPRDWDPSIAVPPRVSFDQCYPKEIQEKVLANWTSGYGFPPEDERPAG